MAEFRVQYSSQNNDGKPTKIITQSWQVVGRQDPGGRREGGGEEEGVGCREGGVYCRGREM